MKESVFTQGRTCNLQTVFGRAVYVRKLGEKTVWNLKIKIPVKTSQFPEVLVQNVSGNKVMDFGFLGLFLENKVLT